jgi:hypothetical protein
LCRLTIEYYYDRSFTEFKLTAFCPETILLLLLSVLFFLFFTFF